MQYKRNIIPESTLIKEAIEILNALSGKDSHTLFVINPNGQVIGSLSDGDIRRGMLANKTITSAVTEVMQKSFRFLRNRKFTLDEIDELRKREITLVPMLDDTNRLIRIVDLSGERSALPLDAVIMAGGEGRRLLPLTRETPKPLLPVGGKPIIEYNLERLEKYGIKNVHISVNYLGDKIETHLGNGSNKELNINYCREDKPLGTLGSVSLVKEFENEVVLVMNSDLLTNIDYEDFYKDFLRKEADMAVATIPYSVPIPYAVIETEEDRVISLREKPTYTYYSNAGIYLIRKDLFRYLPGDTFYNATDLMDAVIRDGLKLTYYPLYCYWLDIGSPTDYEKAQHDCDHIKF